ncbi:hypothetical protein [Frondihabitans australicus]|uniref:Uncharacterized protein n=1 Tax=Frondihabitans australicus TaxID=386892 RepID=A0A495IHI0_9MICO|nr:hypothetical protein [Frondihabitans australicus]RKR74761.1 hypothetical protein C8E83_1890 [Frondihabitans australicus]
MTEASSATPIWSRGLPTLPTAEWVSAFDDLTGDENGHAWALSAATFIDGFTRRQLQGPTFSEMFRHLLHEHDGLPAEFPPGMRSRDRVVLKEGFRHHVALAWRRTGLISWTRFEYRSLRVGPTFRRRSRMRPLSHQLDVGRHPDA